MAAAHIVHVVPFPLDGGLISGAFPAEMVETLCACSFTLGSSQPGTNAFEDLHRM